MQSFRQKIIGLVCLAVIGNILFSSNFLYARRIREPEQRLIVIYEGREIVLSSEVRERIKDKLGVTRSEIREALEHPNWVSKVETGWIFYRRHSSKHNFCVEVDETGVVQDAFYRRTGHNTS
ncbi:MAG: hypothetical protein P9L98_03875 [Candidatus Kaelpia imicola]|nr:hypothetical protein [Candidatus Kaelpia imicola]